MLKSLNCCPETQGPRRLVAQPGRLFPASLPSKRITVQIIEKGYLSNNEVLYIGTLGTDPVGVASSPNGELS